jgi:hypothetical protein
MTVGIVTDSASGLRPEITTMHTKLCKEVNEKSI